MAKIPRTKKVARRFGGRATAGGVNYEVRVAALIAVHMLAGDRCMIWDGVGGDAVGTITLQANDAVDDVVATLQPVGSRAFIQAKDRSSAIALTKRSKAFIETIAGCVDQFLILTPSARTGSRLLWVVPSTAGKALTNVLLEALDSHRKNASNSPFSDFLRHRNSNESKALKALVATVTDSWRQNAGTEPSEGELREFLRMLHVEVCDFGRGNHRERQAQNLIRSHIAANPAEAARIWATLEGLFADADERGITVTAASLRRELTITGFTLNAPPNFAVDIARLRELTRRNLARLKQHTSLSFGSKAADLIHIPRPEELTSLAAAVKAGHLLLTGDPGCGKSGLVHPLAEMLEAEGNPIVVLLAEEIFGREQNNPASLLGITHALDDVLSNWPDGARGFLITDALDAVRDNEMQKMLRRLLRDVQEGQSGWTVLASVREFDLKHGQELREAFPGEGAAGYASKDFAGVAHFHLTGLTEAQVDELGVRRPEIRAFVESARQNAKSSALHLSPFYLRLAADLLRSGVAPARIADWNSPALLLRSFWQRRVENGDGADEREAALATICRQMVAARSMALSAKEISLTAVDRTALRQLRSAGILQSPVLRHGARISEEDIRFTHHLLHDYAIARSLIPATRERFCDFAVREPLLPVFYRQSFMFALEELWDADDQRDAFWEAAIRLEGVHLLHGITRILGPILAARRVKTLTDLRPLLAALAVATEADNPAAKALRHLSSGLQDAGKDSIRAGATGWSEFAEQLSTLLATHQFIEGPLVHILARINATGVSVGDVQFRALNTAGRTLIAAHLTRPAAQAWRYLAHVGIETVCRTFGTAPHLSKATLLGLMTPERLAQFPHNDLSDLADNLKHLSAEGDPVVLRLFEAAFDLEPKTGEWEQFGSVIMPMTIQTSDQWNHIHYSLAEYYANSSAANAEILAEAACIAWNAVVRRRRDGAKVIASIQFRGVRCELIEDYSHISRRGFEHEENRILSRFETLLREWAAAEDMARLGRALDGFSKRNRSALMWSLVMEAGAEHPATLGALLADVLKEPTILANPDYAYGAAALFGALHATAESPLRQTLESLVFDLPKNVRLWPGERRNPMPSRVEYAQDRLLSELKESNIVLPKVAKLWRSRNAKQELKPRRRSKDSDIEWESLSDEERFERQGVSLKDPVNKELFDLQESLKPFLPTDSAKFDVVQATRLWTRIARCELAVRKHRARNAEMTCNLWGHLVGACRNLAEHARWPKSSARWKTVRRILLKAAVDPKPSATDKEEEETNDLMTWSWPAPRIDAAQGLPFLALRMEGSDKALSTAIGRLSRDKSKSVRFHVARVLPVLRIPAPSLMWGLIDGFIRDELRFSVLNAVLDAMSWLWAEPETVMVRVRQIGERAKAASPDNGIHQALAATHLFQYLRTGRMECDVYITVLIDVCDTPLGSQSLLSQLHPLRDGGWLISRDDSVRARVWNFLSRLLHSSFRKLQEHRQAWQVLHQGRTPTNDEVTCVQEPLGRATRLVDSICMQLLFATGAHSANDVPRLDAVQMSRFWTESESLLQLLAKEIHSHTAYHLIQTLRCLLPCNPRRVFLLAAKSIRSASEAGFQNESLAAGEVVKLVQQVLADYREIFQSVDGGDSECLSALLNVLDLFVEAGWPQARQLTHRLEEIYR